MRRTIRGLAAVLALIFAVGALAASGEDDEAKKDDKTEEGAKKEEGDKAEESEDSASPSQKNARRSAEQYLEMGGFSRDGLSEQLQIGDEYPKADAEWAVDDLDVDWNEQAAISAEGYLEMDGFSRDGLIQQLIEGDGFTQEQAEYGTSEAGL